MSAAEKLRLKKEIEKYLGFAGALTRADLFSGRWFARLLEERGPAFFAVAPTPPELRERLKGIEGEEDLADAVVTRAIHEAIAATDAYEENLTGTEIRNFKDRKNAKSTEKLGGDSLWLIAELAYTIQIDLQMIINLAAAYGKQVGPLTEQAEGIFGRALGAFDYEAAREEGDALAKIGAKIYDRAIVQALGSDLADAQRKGFYCYYTKAISKEARKAISALPPWEPPKAQTGPMTAAAADDGLGFQV